MCISFTFDVQGRTTGSVRSNTEVKPIVEKEKEKGEVSGERERERRKGKRAKKGKESEERQRERRNGKRARKETEYFRSLSPLCFSFFPFLLFLFLCGRGDSNSHASYGATTSK
jgi:recombinational DNA repair ATPase RecF